MNLSRKSAVVDTGWDALPASALIPGASCLGSLLLIEKKAFGYVHAVFHATSSCPPNRQSPFAASGGATSPAFDQHFCFLLHVFSFAVRVPRSPPSRKR